MYQRDMASYQERQQRILEKLVDEAANGITKCDTLPNKAQPLQNEVEAMYFNSIRIFFTKMISHKVMSYDQDIYEGR